MTIDLSFEFALAIQAGRLDEVSRIVAGNPGALGWTNVSGGTALRAAVVGGEPHLPVVAYLLDQGAAIDAQDAEGMSPLMFAALHGAGACITLLLARSATTGLEDKRGRSAAAIALEYGHPEAAAQIENHAEETRRAAAEKKRLALEAEAAAPHEGLTREIPVKKLLMLKRSAP